MDHDFQSGQAALRRRIWLWIALAIGILLAKLCDLDILWAEEGYGAAAAVQILHGKALYRDFWFDKPPLAALIYVLWHGMPGLGLRLADTLYDLACCLAAFRLACHLWSEREGMWASCFMAVFLLFDIPASVTTLAPDLLLVLPALLAVDCAARRKPFWSGVYCSAGLAVNAKALLIVAVCLVWCWPAFAELAAGFAAGSAPWLVWLAATGALAPYFRQVWLFGSVYSKDTFVVHPWREGMVRTLDWAGFHAALLVGAAACFTLRKLWNDFAWIFWLVLGFLGVIAGERFFPRYYFILLPPLVILAAGGVTLVKQRWRVLTLCLLAIPLARFGPRYFLLATDELTGRQSTWSDVALNQDSQRASKIINAGKQPGDSLLVWGYRPDLFAYTQLPVAGPFLDSQLLTGVLADRHLTEARASFPVLAAANRVKLRTERPAWIVDGIGVLNPRLAITTYPELSEWLNSSYILWGRTRFCTVYHRLRHGS